VPRPGDRHRAGARGDVARAAVELAYPPIVSDHACFVFFRSGSVTLDDAAQRLAAAGLDVQRAGDQIAVRWGQGPQLRIRFARDPRVVAEARAIGANTPHAAALGQCDARFEVRFDDLAHVLDEVNTLIEVQLTLQEATGGVLFTSWNQAVTAS